MEYDLTRVTAAGEIARAARQRKERALVRALGFDPDTHHVEVVSGQWPGLQIVDGGGKKVRFVTRKALKKAAFQRLWAQELKAAP